MKIVPVREGDGLTEFVEFPWTVYRNDPRWIPPLREQLYHELSGRSAFSSYGRMQLFVAESEGRIAGRIAALWNPRLADESGTPLGQLGYFECVEDASVAAALAAAGLDWLRVLGAREALAPMNGGAHRTHRFLTRGFESEPFLFEPRNPPYYPLFFERCGFAPAHRWFSYELTGADAAGLAERFEAALARKPPDGTIEELPADRPRETIARIHRLLDGCWTGHVGYAPLAVEEFAEVFRGVLSIMRPGNVSVFVQGGSDAGCAFVYPDYAAEVRALNGRAAGWGEWLGNSAPRRIVLHTAALLPEARKSSAAMAQVAWCLRTAVRQGFDRIVVALAVEGFVSRIGERTREYALYRRSLD